MPGFKPYDVGRIYMPLTPHLYNEYHDRTCLIVEMIGVNLHKALRVCTVYSKLSIALLITLLGGSDYALIVSVQSKEG